LYGVPTNFRRELLVILATITAQFALAAPELEKFLELRSGYLSLILRNLHSVIMAEGDNTQVSVHHASFLDFLEDQSRSGPFYVGSSQHCTNVSYLLLKAFSYRQDDAVGW
jgi:hypothetical protein